MSQGPRLNWFQRRILAPLVDFGQRLPKGCGLLIGFIGLCLAVLVGLNYYLRPTTPDLDALAIAPLTPRAMETEVGGLGTPDYNRLIDEQNAIKAKEALANG